MKVRDQMNRELECNARPKRIISLVPSQTEFLYDLGLRAELVGITKFCVHPHELYRSCERVGGTKQLDLEKIRYLQPDLIIGNKEENTKEQIAQLAEQFPVWLSDVNTVPDALAMMRALATLCDREKAGAELLRASEEAMRYCQNIFKDLRVLYLIWHGPWMGVGSETFIHAMLRHIGFANALADQSRYPILEESNFKALSADFCFLSSEPFPFSEKHSTELQHLHAGKPVFVDGEMFSWYGSRLIKAGPYFKELKEKLDSKERVAFSEI